ncbi:MAG: hypothetical protein RI883_348 [Bacteroidota bacterium]|jgi:NAD(P)H dehydrogenase (quinone)
MNKRILIVHAHPEEKSFCASIKNTMVKYYEEHGAEVKISSLYEMKFNPVGGKEDFLETKESNFFKYQMEQLNAAENNLFSDDVQTEMDKFEWCDTLIFNFPLWWFGLPAILKGWVDRIFAMGKVYGNGKGVYDNGSFKEKSAFITMTTGGPIQAYGDEGKNGDLNTILFPIHHGMFYFVGMKVYPPFVCFSPARISDEERQSELLRLEDYLNELNNQKTLF